MRVEISLYRFIGIIDNNPENETVRNGPAWEWFRRQNDKEPSYGKTV